MEYEDFAASPSGTVVKTISGAPAFVPAPLPPQLDISAILGPFTRATERIGALQELTRQLHNPYLLTRPLLSKEAVSSSSMEGTITTLTDLFAFEAGVEKRTVSQETREVYNYVQALNVAISRLDDIPVSHRLICEAHAILLQDVGKARGLHKQPGQFRTTEPAWTGTLGTPLSEARFVFVPPSHVIETFGQFEKYISTIGDEDGVPALVKIALVHYQFEAIHPFHDGNGRVGRLLIPLLLHQLKMLPQPILYLSSYLEQHKDEYIDRLYNVSRFGQWEEWVSFFLTAISEQADDTITRAHGLQGLQNLYRNRLSQARQSALALQLVDTIFESPVLTIPRAKERLNTSYQTAKNNVDKLINAGILVEAGTDQRPKWFLAPQVYEIIHASLDEIKKQFPDLIR